MQSGDRAHLHVGLKSGLAVPQPVLDAWLAARGTPGAWLTCAYDAAAKDTIVLRDTGSSGGWPACAATLADDVVTYGAFSFTLGGLHRTAFFTFVGARVSPLKRGKVPLHRGAVYAAFEGCSADLSLTGDPSALEPAAVIAQLSRLLTQGAVAL